MSNPLSLLAIWTSISSYGGFVGGALGFGYVAWRRKLPVARWADINVLVLWLAFRRRLPQGALAAVIAALYAPVRFGLERWRLASTDPPYGGLTFAQWCSIAVFVIAVALAARIARSRRELR